MTLTVDDFRAFHAAVHGADSTGQPRVPFDWQMRLLGQIIADGRWPRVLDLPTGAGKTTCIDIAVFALALDAERPPELRWCPRRTAMVVDRRVVVDQVAERGRKLLSRLLDPAGNAVVEEVGRRLRSLSRDATEPLAVFTLRGGMPKDDGWARTPDQPLILASTVDQIGSRLLVQGYGVSRGMKPVHAGLCGNDLLLLLDEVHLSQPFADTLQAIERLRPRQERGQVPLPRRFQHVMLSATPGESSHAPFRLLESEKRSDSALGPRLHASKPARVVEVADRTALEKRCVDDAVELTRRHDVVAVVVNRLASASNIAAQLRETLGESCDVAVLTGRMRPLDRDDALRRLRPRILTGRDRAVVERKLIVVGTQCIEAGADFDFDAIVTEAASLDALRQRFGRVDRLGTYGKAEGVVVADKSQKDDPIYGDALAATIRWLREKLGKKTKTVDFGVLAFPPPPSEEMAGLLAPKPGAPVLLPAYMDLWMQSAPAPSVVPDVTLWLHGPTAGPADVQVIWRADLTEDDLQRESNEGRAPRLAAVVGALRPSSLEALSLPFVAAKRWMAGERVGDIADVEGRGADDDDATGGKKALRWQGDESEVVSAAELRPGDTIIVPSSRGGIVDGCFDAAAPRARGELPWVVDRAEEASFFSRGRTSLRVHEAVLRGLGVARAAQEIADDPSVLLEDAEGRDDWLAALLRAVARRRRTITVPGDPGWVVLEGRRATLADLRALRGETAEAVERGADLTTDDEDSYRAGVAVTLSRHSGDVERFAAEYARTLGLPDALSSDLALAGWLHDIGKADPRFQLMLRGGSEIDLFKSPALLAKSGMAAAASAAHQLAQQRSRYPRGARHEVQSVAMIEAHLDAVRSRASDLDLVLHLVASHHGHCRPFAPVVVDDDPVNVDLAGHTSSEFGTIDFGPTSSRHGLHRLDSPLADRFWRLVERYGWLELCWLESILRLADHRASEAEQEDGHAT